MRTTYSNMSPPGAYSMTIQRYFLVKKTSRNCTMCGWSSIRWLRISASTYFVTYSRWIHRRAFSLLCAASHATHLVSAFHKLHSHLLRRLAFCVPSELNEAECPLVQIAYLTTSVMRHVVNNASASKLLFCSEGGLADSQARVRPNDDSWLGVEKIRRYNVGASKTDPMQTSVCIVASVNGIESTRIFTAYTTPTIAVTSSLNFA